MANENSTTVVFVLTDRQDSPFVKVGTQGTKHERRLNSPSDFRMPNTSFRIEETKDEKGKVISSKRVPIRYIFGCDEIDVDKQKADGIQPSANPEMDEIVFKNGIFTVIQGAGEESGLYKFMMEAIDNEAKSPRGVKSTYRIHDEAKLAEDELRHRSALQEASKLINGLYKEGAGDKPMTYDERKINFLCSLLNMSSAASYPQKVLALNSIAEKTPQLLLDTIANAKDDIRTTLAAARGMKAIYFKESDILWGVREGKIMTCSGKAKTPDAQTEELMEYLLSDEGRDDYQQLKKDIETLREKELEVQ